MARIPQEVIRSVQDSVDVVDVISEFVSLKRTGNSFKGLCPFHEEKTPSFHVFPATGTFKCFGCGEHGRAIDFLMRHTRATFREVVAQLADRSGIAIPEEPQSPQEADAAQRRVGVLQALRFANGFFRAV
ncbi:MAG: CHC2 zinc finger domain-containing protein, partial [Planctomycetota bacterium]|nr:CHC2 zinc finger domain-containing protein [Planctomycetota bacterium]